MCGPEGELPWRLVRIYVQWLVGSIGLGWQAESDQRGVLAVFARRALVDEVLEESPGFPSANLWSLLYCKGLPLQDSKICSSCKRETIKKGQNTSILKQ